jgi:AraC-like DNA-binding protein
LFEQNLVDIKDEVTRKVIFGRKAYFNHREDGILCRKLESLLLSIRDEYHSRRKGYRLFIRTKIYEIALIFLREIPEQKINPNELAGHKYNHQILERVFSFIHSNFSNPGITLEQVADVAALSKFYFTRFFRRQIGQTFHSYLSQVRINRAEEYLVNSELSIVDIAFLCGFSSLKTFNRVFKDFTGNTPSNYRSGRK